MDGGQLTAVIIVAIIMVASIIKVAMRGPSRRRLGCDDQPGPQIQAENQRLRDEVSQLKERLHVLERITVEKENSLSREIDSLRDR
jgi:uncharacterized protein YlxW (UPF0749 family)